MPLSTALVTQLNQPAKVTKKKGGALAESCSGGFKTLSVPVSLAEWQ